MALPLDEQRRRAAKNTRPLPSALKVKVVGVTFAPGYPETLHRLRAIAEEYGLLVDRDDERPTGEVKLEAALVREPENPVDPNAVAILALGQEIGHLPAAIAARLAPELDAGGEWTCDVASVVAFPSRPEQPGVWVELRRSA